MNRLDNTERTPRKGSVMDEEASTTLRATVTKSGRKVKRPLHLASPDRTLPVDGGRGSPAKPIGRKSTKASVTDERVKAAPGTPNKQSVSTDDQKPKEKPSSRKTLTRKTLTSGNSEVTTPKKGNELPNAEESGVSKSGRKLKVPAKLTDFESSLVGSPRKGSAPATTGEREAAKTPARAVRSAKKVALESSANKPVAERIMGRKTNVSDTTAAESTPTKSRGRRARSVAPVKPAVDEPLSEEERVLKATRTPGRKLMGISMIDIGPTIEPQQTKQRKRTTVVETNENENVVPVSKTNTAKTPKRKTTAPGTLVSEVVPNPSDEGNVKGENKAITTEQGETIQATQSGTVTKGAEESNVQEAQKELIETKSPAAEGQQSSQKMPRGPSMVASEASAACSLATVSPEGQGFSRSGRKIKPKKIFGTEDGDGDKATLISTAASNDTPANSFVTRRNLDDHHHASTASKMVPSVEPIDEPDRAVPFIGATTAVVDESIDVPPTSSSRSGRIIKPKKFFDDGSFTGKKKSLGTSPARRQEEGDSEAVGKLATKQSPIVSNDSIIVIPDTPAPGKNVNEPPLEGVDVAEGPSVEDDTNIDMQNDAVTDNQTSSKSITSEILQEAEGNEIDDAILPSSKPQSPSAADDPVEERTQSDPAEANEEALHTEDVMSVDGSESTHLDDTKPTGKQSPVAIVGPSETSIIEIPDTPAPDVKHSRQLSDTFSPEKPTLPNDRIPHIVPEITISEAPTVATTDSCTVAAAPRTPDTKTNQANECSPDKPPEVIEVLDSPASMAFGTGNSASSTPLILLNAGENNPTSHRKRSMSTSAAEAKKRNVTFHSPANVTVLVDTIDELMQKKVVRRKRSLSEHAPGAAIGADDGVKPNKISKIPNFKSIHEKNFKRMESIGDFMKRKEKRAQLILKAASPATKLLAQGASAATTTATNAPPDAKNNHATIEKKPERLFTFKSGGGGGTSAATTSMITKAPTTSDSANVPTVAAALFKRGPIAKGHASSLKRPITSTEQRLANRQRLYKTAPLANATSDVVASPTAGAASAPSATSSTTIRPVDQLRTKQSTILKGVRTNRRFELQMKHRDNMQ
ncbi:uncharacterized protein LOC118461689 [Anopheles albimanus]|uniref:Uncharacterized protein n=1 Tax=Anopheles albimanus TaxID=7167 RepID=A0A182FAR9_ANOAL|nr:uncharacterized protein LOC118461689 [Anopheles albimanus]